VIAVLGPEMLRDPDIVERVKFKRLLPNGDLPCAYLGSNIVSLPELLISIGLLRESQARACL
jgi:hypothetical protein